MHQQLKNEMNRQPLEQLSPGPYLLAHAQHCHGVPRLSDDGAEDRARRILAGESEQSPAEASLTSNNRRETEQLTGKWRLLSTGNYQATAPTPSSICPHINGSSFAHSQISTCARLAPVLTQP